MDTFRPKVILVATDFGKPAARALRYASAIAARCGARMIVLYVDEFIVPASEIAVEASLPNRSVNQLLFTIEGKLIAHVQRNLSSHVPFETRVIVGPVSSSIVDESKECGADLLVMGTSRRTGLRRLLTGSVCESVMRAVSIPVIAVGTSSNSNESLDIDKVICVADQSPECAEALRMAAAVAPEARLILVKPADEAFAAYPAESLTRLRRWLPFELVDRCELKLVDASWPAADLTRLAASAGAVLIAAGAPHIHEMSDSVQGTATEKIIRHSECPVLVVNTRAVRQVRAEEKEAVAASSCACDA